MPDPVHSEVESKSCCGHEDCPAQYSDNPGLCECWETEANQCGEHGHDLIFG